MYITRFKLKQHTPIIHFQPDDSGSTLRASEVKPKLDKFIYKKLGEKAIKDYWFIAKKDHKALNYKLHLRDTQKTDSFNQLPMYFARDQKKGKLSKDGIDGSVKTIHKDLLGNIEKHLAEFFFYHNFGTRQSKGYGSFTLEKVEDVEVKTNFKTEFSFTIESKGWFKVMNDIDLFYKSLRSGINHRIYCKPVIFLYAKEGIKNNNNETQLRQWDKRSIKENFYNNKLNAQIKKHWYSDVLKTKDDLKEPKWDFRDLFGLSSHENWMRKYDNDKLKKVHGSADRFKSPITFKPIKVKHNLFLIYLHFDEIPQKADSYAGEEITIYKNYISDTVYEAKMTLQMAENIQMEDIFKFIVSTEDIIKKLVHNKYHDRKDYKKLKNIYNEIKKSNELNKKNDI